MAQRFPQLESFLVGRRRPNLAEWAEIIGLSHTVLSRLRSGTMVPTVDEVGALSSALEAPTTVVVRRLRMIHATRWQQLLDDLNGAARR
jgi:hypothetical protein